MEKLDEKILARLEELKVAGDALLATSRDVYGPNVITANRHHVTAQDAQRWGMSCLNLLEKTFGANSAFYQRFQVKLNDFPKTFYVNEALGILRSAKDEFEHGFLFNTKTLIAAEIFEDFLEQAEHLLEAGYAAPAAVIAGSVLEDGLRKLCVSNEVELPDIPKLDWMNSQLAKEGVYTKLVQKQITATADLRNKAAHGQWDEFAASDVELMMSQVRSFMGTHFA